MKRKNKAERQRHVKRRKEEKTIGKLPLDLSWRRKQGNSNHCVPYATWHLIQLYLREVSVGELHSKQRRDMQKRFSLMDSPSALLMLLKQHPVYSKVFTQGFRIKHMAHLLFCVTKTRSSDTTVCYAEKDLAHVIEKLFERGVPFVFSYHCHAYTAVSLQKDVETCLVIDSRCMLGINRFKIATLKRDCARLLWFEQKTHAFAKKFCAPTDTFCEE